MLYVYKSYYSHLSTYFEFVLFIIYISFTNTINTKINKQIQNTFTYLIFIFILK